MKYLFGFLSVTILFAISGVAQPPAGTYNGNFRSSGPTGTISMIFTRSGETPAGETAIQFDDREAKAEIQALSTAGNSATFSSDLAGARATFTGKSQGAKFIGTFELMERGLRTLVGSFCVSRDDAAKCVEADLPPLPNLKLNVQRADDTYDTTISNPAYSSKHPKVLFDEAHRNFHKTTTNFKPFADLIRNDGYKVTPNTEKFSATTLKGHDILVISNARGDAGQSAFTDDEIAAVVEWVRAGGSLLLVADHTPFGGFAEKLANAFGVDMSKGYTDDPQNRDPVIKQLLFSRENKLLGDHPITNGRSANERINRVVSFTGQSLRADGAADILKLADTAYDEFPNSDRKIPAAGRAQALAMKFGKGRIFVSGEAAMLTAQFTPDDKKFGMNVPGIDNRQYALNLMHWLSGLLK